jgi:hypothetical protein
MNLGQKTRAIFHGRKAKRIVGHSKERKRLTSTLLFCHKKPAETHQLMALPIMASSNPTRVKIRDVP